MKKLFEIGIDIENIIYVMGENQDEAKEIAKENIRDESYYNFSIWTREIKLEDPYVNVDWQNSIPYGSNNDKTCFQIVDEMREIEKLKKIRAEEDKKQLKFGFYKNVKNS